MKKEDRIEVIRQAYKGLFQLTTRGLFDKYVDFIDVYSEISEQEQQKLHEDIIQHKETAVLAQYIKDKGKQEGKQEGRQEVFSTMIRNMKNNNLSDQEIAKAININIETIRKVINKEPVEIPLHLLGEQNQS